MGLIADAREIDMDAEAEERKRVEAIIEKKKRKTYSDDLEDPKEERSDLLKRQKKADAQTEAEKKAWDEEYVKRLQQSNQA